MLKIQLIRHYLLQVALALYLKRVISCEELEDQCPKCPYIDLLIVLVAGQYLR